MFVRRKLNKSGSISVQVLSKRNGRNVLMRSFGSSRIEAEVCEMERRAHDFIDTSYKWQHRTFFFVPVDQDDETLKQMLEPF